MFGMKLPEQAKAGAMLDEGFMVDVRAKTVQQRGREEVYAALLCAASFHCLVEEWKDCEDLKRILVDRKREDARHRAEWSAEATNIVRKRQQASA